MIEYLILYDKKVFSFHLGEHILSNKREGIKMPLTSFKEKVRGLSELIKLRFILLI